MPVLSDFIECNEHFFLKAVASHEASALLYMEQADPLFGKANILTDIKHWDEQQSSELGALYGLWKDNDLLGLYALTTTVPGEGQLHTYLIPTFYSQELDELVVQTFVQYCQDQLRLSFLTVHGPQDRQRTFVLTPPRPQLRLVKS